MGGDSVVNAVANKSSQIPSPELGALGANMGNSLSTGDSGVNALANKSPQTRSPEPVVKEIDWGPTKGLSFRLASSLQRLTDKIAATFQAIENANEEKKVDESLAIEVKAEVERVRAVSKILPTGGAMPLHQKRMMARRALTATPLPNNEPPDLPSLETGREK